MQPERCEAEIFSTAPLWAGLLGALLVCAPCVVYADSRVVLIGSSGTAADGTPFDLQQLDAALLSELRETQRLRVVGGLERPSAIRREFHCASLDAACLERVAVRRGVDRVLLGTVSAPTATRASSEADAADALLTVRIDIFDVFRVAMHEDISGTIDASHLDSDSRVQGLAAKLSSLIARLPEEGSATIRAIAGSSVYLDDRSMGTVAANGELVLRPLRVGRRELRVVRPNHSIWEAPIVVRSREAIFVTVDAGGSVASFDDAAARAQAGAIGTSVRLRSGGAIEPPPDYILEIPGVTSSVPEVEDVIQEGEVLARVRFHIPMIDEHIGASGEIRTSTHARIGFLPNVSSSGARVTAKLRF